MSRPEPSRGAPRVEISRGGHWPYRYTVRASRGPFSATWERFTLRGARRSAARELRSMQREAEPPIEVLR